MTDLTDARGRSLHEFTRQSKRIVSLVPSQTELLYHLGLDAEVVGITKFCVHPQHWFLTKKRVGGTKNVSIDKVKALQPDLILANKEENMQEQVEELANYFPVWVTDVFDLNSALEMIETVGSLTGKSEKATFLNAHISSAFQSLEQASPTKQLRTCYLIWKEPYLTVGGDTFIHHMLQYAGFQNLFAVEKRYPEVTLETLQHSACDLLLLSSEPYPFKEIHKAALQQHLPNTKILLVDGEMFSWYGSRLQWAPAYFKKLHEEFEAMYRKLSI